MATSWKTLRVFISSTFKDMHAERDHLVRFVFPRLREDLLRYRIHLIDVDLRWGVTSDQDSVTACREIIDECHPRFMGMLGGRYGSVPAGLKRSITEDEVHYGVLQREAEIWGNAFFYFRDDEATVSIMEKVPCDYREPEGSEAAQKLARLKQSIVDAGLPAFTYGATWDAALDRLTGLEAFGDHVYAYLLKNMQDDPELDDHFDDSSANPVDEFAEEREAMEAFIEDRTERYVVGSRQELLNQMIAFAAADSEQNVLVIEGEPGSGKSSLLGKLCKLLAIQRTSLTIPHLVGASIGSTDLRRTLRRLCHELAVAAGSSDLLPEDTWELIDLFSELLSETAARRRVVLIIDAINQFDATDGAHYMDWLPPVLPPNIRIIASSLEHPALAALRSRSKPVRIEKLEPLSETDTHAIIQAFLQRYGIREEGYVRVWDTRSGECMAVLTGHTSKIKDALELADGRLVSWSSDEPGFRLWNGHSGSSLKILRGPAYSLWGVRQLPNKQLLSWGPSRKLHLWNDDRDPSSKEITEDQAAIQHPELLYEREQAENPDRLSANFFVNDSIYSARLIHRTIAPTCFQWNGASPSRTLRLCADGTLVIRQENRQFCIVKLFLGNSRYTLEEAERFLQESSSEVEIKSQNGPSRAISPSSDC